MLQNSYLHQYVILIFLLPALVFSTGISDDAIPQPDDPIDFSAYPKFTSLRTCLRTLFGGPSGGGIDNQVAINVRCEANSCLCTPENIVANLPHISSQVRESCTNKRDVVVATSVLSGYCSRITAGLMTTTLGGGVVEPTQTPSEDAEPIQPPNGEGDDKPVDDSELPSEENPSGGLSIGVIAGIGVSIFFGIVAASIGIRGLYYASDAQKWRQTMS